MLFEMTKDEIHEALTEWLNRHRFSEPVRVTRLRAAHHVRVGNEDSKQCHMVDFEYPRKELAGEHDGPKQS
jgi:hypothetical protein